MTRKAYILSFDRDDNLDYVAFHKQLTELPNVLTWWHYIKSSYILISDLTSSTELNRQIMAIAPKKRFFLVEINIKNRNGWLPPQAWEWLKKESRRQQ